MERENKNKAQSPKVEIQSSDFLPPDLLKLLEAAGIEVTVVRLSPPELFVTDRAALEKLIVDSVMTIPRNRPLPSEVDVKGFAALAVQTRIDDGTFQAVELEDRPSDDGFGFTRHFNISTN